MGRWVRVASANDISVGQCRGISLEGREIGLFNVDGEFFAMDNLCPHRGAPLSDGRLDGAQIVCPWHGWAFDVRGGGLVMNPNQCQKTFPVEKRGGDVFVEVGDDGRPPSRPSPSRGEGDARGTMGPHGGEGKVDRIN